MKIDTTSNENVIEILDEKFQITDKHEKTMARNESEIMLSWIDEIVGEKLHSIRGIVVCIGPGSYTGVRVGVTIANSMAFSLNIPILGYKIGECINFIGLKEGSFGAPAIPYYEREPLITKPKARL
ncbi:MAG: tRNA (adenosine(37)-N6)-threonylcarbamoyltransferase complex dimerization subunit type 1 TsaB [Candidatus Berkelbacteria bacterium]